MNEERIGAALQEATDTENVTIGSGVLASVGDLFGEGFGDRSENVGNGLSVAEHVHLRQGLTLSRVGNAKKSHQSEADGTHGRCVHEMAPNPGGSL